MRQLTDREKQIEMVARFLMDEYGLNQWSLDFRHMTATLGRTWHIRKHIRLSTYFIATKSYTRMLNTILHEIAHALSPERGHGRTWKRIAESIGAIPRARLSDALFDSEKR